MFIILTESPNSYNHLKQKNMNKVFLSTPFKSSLFLLLTSVTLICCKKNDPVAAAGPGTITAQVSAGSNFTLLKSAVIKAGLAPTLDGTGNFTVFAPTDEAFTSSGVTSSVIGSLSGDQLKKILLDHTLTSKILAAAVPAGPNAKVITASGDSIFVTKNSNGVYVNGVNVTMADLPASNGVIHTMSKVLLPASGNIVQVASSDTAFSFLVAAVLRASTGSTNVAAILSGPGILTVFAPVNNAFRALGFATIDAINAADPNALTAILTYHVVPGRVFACDLSNGIQAATANGAKLTIGIAGSAASVKGLSNPTASAIIGTNLMATNGVVHVIDQVLLP
jgi:uncharacterized surface protein with fasciclin (FAS1) repeats